MIFTLRMSKISINSSIDSWVFGPGIEVVTRGALGSLGKKGVSSAEDSCIVAVATLAAGRAVLVMGRESGIRVRGRRREVVLKKDAMVRSCGEFGGKRRYR